MTINSHVSTFDIQNCGDQGSAIEVRSPVLEQYFGGFIREYLNPFPDCHPVFQMLPLDIAQARGGERFFNDLVGIP